MLWYVIIWYIYYPFISYISHIYLLKPPLLLTGPSPQKKPRAIFLHFVGKLKHSWSFFCAGVDGHGSTSGSLRNEIEEEFLNEEKLFQSEIKIRAFHLQRKPKSSHHCTELLMYGICSHVEIVKVLKFIVISKIRKTQEDESLKKQWYKSIYY